MKRNTLFSSILALLLLGVLISTPNSTFAQRNGRHQGGGGQYNKGFWTDLTQEQRDALNNLIQELRNQGATPEEIHEAVIALLKQYGIEKPDSLKNCFNKEFGLNNYG